jgi:hypothetical protein
VKKSRPSYYRKSKKRRFRDILLGFPLTIVLLVVNIVLIGWLIHVLHAIFTDALTHMSLYEWTEHLYNLARNTFKDFFASIFLVL